jgi:hypothetical protein
MPFFMDSIRWPQAKLAKDDSNESGKNNRRFEQKTV